MPSTVTWTQLLGYDYSPGMPQPVDLRRKRLPPQSPAVASLITALGGVAQAGGPRPRTHAQAWGNGALTPHNAGAAVDIFYHANGTQSRAFANGLLGIFIRLRHEIGWGYISYNHMHFTLRSVSAATADNDHQDHIHIEWVDYRRAVMSHLLESFEYVDARGRRTKRVGAAGQCVSMSWNAGADRPMPAIFQTQLTALCAAVQSSPATLAAMSLTDFQTAYA